MDKIKTKPESFTLDHTKVVAPYVRLINKECGVNGDVIVNFDVRLTQPNVQFIDPSALHTIEHSAAGLLRDVLPSDLRLIDSSPFGCFTGFHNILWMDGEYTDSELVAELIKAWEYALTQILTFEDDDVPAVTEKECGNAAMHSLHGAKIWSERVLGNGFSNDPFTHVSQ